MEQLSFNTDEICMNIDTIEMLKKDNISVDEIYEMFENDIEYNKELVTSLLELQKSYVRSMAMRINLRLKTKIKPEKIKLELSNYNKEITPVINKLLS